MQNKNVVIVIVLIIVIGAIVYFSSSKSASKVENEQQQVNTETNMNNSMNMEESPLGTPEGPSAPVESMDGKVKEFTVVGSNFKFSPSTMTVNKGDTVKITFKNVDGFHDFMIAEFNVATKQISSGSQEVVTFVADKAGTFEYYCSVGKHRQMGMKGTLTVK